MRPVRLEIEGFGTFRDRTVIDFADLDLVAVVGPTGSGKSTIIDAITFALYGSVARYDNPSLVAPVIHQLSAEAKVRLDFEVAGQHYVAVRVVRRVKSKPGAAPRATTREARLERRLGSDVDDGSTSVVAGNVGELDDAVRDLLGLDFTQFTRTIVLPQGDFAEFLTDDPGNRQKLLRRLLDIDIYARMGAVARERAAAAGQQAEVYRHELDRLAEITTERLTEAEARAKALTGLTASVGAVVADLADLETDLAERRAEVSALDVKLAGLAAIEVPTGLAEAGAALDEASAAVEETAAALATARDGHDRAVAAAEQAGDPAALQSVLDRFERRASLVESLAAVEAELAETRDARTDLDRGLSEAQERLDGAIEAARAARVGADAAVWVERLVVGEPCPICGHEVHEVDPDRVGTDVAAAEAEVDRAERARSELTASAARLDGRIAGLDGERAERAAAVDELTSSLDDVAGPDAVTQRLAAAEAARHDLAGAESALRAAERAATTATAALTDLRAATERFRTSLTAARDGVADLGPPVPAGRSLLDDWAALTDWSAGRADELQGRRLEVAAAGKELAQAKAERLAELAEEVEPFGLAPDPATIVAAVASAQARAESELESLAERLDHKRELAARLADLEERRVVHDSLGRHHLSAAGFERWLLAEALDDIVAKATGRLHELSNGRYSLEAIDGSFSVRDHTNADERRDVRTLSGGEVFLASLSLALALADSIAELAPVDSPRLDSIFLDEGFGTLDGDTLDVLASAIEELSATGRLVVIVTHVRDLAERMPVRFEVRKGPAGSTVERSTS